MYRSRVSDGADSGCALRAQAAAAREPAARRLGALHSRQLGKRVRRRTLLFTAVNVSRNSSKFLRVYLLAPPRPSPHLFAPLHTLPPSPHLTPLSTPYPPLHASSPLSTPSPPFHPFSPNPHPTQAERAQAERDVLPFAAIPHASHSHFPACSDADSVVTA